MNTALPGTHPIEDEATLVPNDAPLPRLIVCAGPHARREFLLLTDELVIGRAAPGATWDIALADRSMASPHARLERKPDGFRLSDLGAGARLNGRPIQAPVLLREGDEVGLGETTLAFRSALGPADGRAASPSRSWRVPELGGPGIWRRLNDDLKRDSGPGPGVWERIAVSPNGPHPSSAPASIWELPGPPDASRRKPARLPGWALRRLTDSHGKPYWVLKNLRQPAYLRLNEQQAHAWNQMDGAHSVQDIAFDQFMRFRTLSIDGLLNLIARLEVNGFLARPPVNVYARLAAQLRARSASGRLRRLLGLLFQSELAIRGIDGLITAAYRFGGRLLFTWPAQLLFLLLSLVGVPFFYLAVKRGDLSFFVGVHGMLHVGLATLVLAQILAVLVHELAHALTTKHYGREVRRGGVGLYFGMIAFFVDTTDIWMEPRRPRIAVTWAGPYSGLVLGAVASLMLMVHPMSVFLLQFHALRDLYHAFLPIVNHRSVWVGLAYQFAAFSYGISFLNLNPLLKLDGYYILMDWLEIPQLRERSLAFVRKGLWGKLQTRQPFSREERVFTAFGLLALAWTGVAVFAMIEFFGGTIFRFIASAAGIWAAWVVAVAALACAAYSLGRRRLAGRRKAPAG